MKIILALIHFVAVFLSCVFREIEPPGKIPEIYRIRGRLSIRLAWGIAKSCYRLRRKTPCVT